MIERRSFFQAMAVMSAAAAVLVLAAQYGLTSDLSPGSREEAIHLYTDPAFRARSWVVLAQVFAMFLALWGAAVRASHHHPGLIWTGFVVFILWQVFELLPRSVGLWTLAYDWAPAFAAAEDPAVRANFEQRILTLDGLITAAAGVRRQLWCVGHLLFGLAFLGRAGLERVLGVLFLFNALRLVLRTLGEAGGVTSLAEALSGRLPFVVGMVPLFGVLAVWLWRTRERAV